MKHTDLYIDGQWCAGASGTRFDVMNPATEEVLASVASAEIADADAALDAAAAAMPLWISQSPRHRSEVLRKAWELMTARLPEFANLITLENGKARADAMGEATYAAEFFRYYAGLADKAGDMSFRFKATDKYPTRKRALEVAAIAREGLSAYITETVRRNSAKEGAAVPALFKLIYLLRHSVIHLSYMRNELARRGIRIPDFSKRFKPKR